MERPARYPWFSEDGRACRVAKEVCRVRAAGFKNFFDSRGGESDGKKSSFPGRRKRQHGSRFRDDADRATPAHARAVKGQAWARCGWART
jgi:putative transposase